MDSTRLRVSSVSLDRYREQFPALASKAYFNYGGQGPLPQAALEAIQQAYAVVQQKGPFSLAVNAWATQMRDRTREAIAENLGVASQTITLTENVTAGCNIALWGMPWQAGDGILLSDCEHPGIIAIAQEIQRRFGVEISFCPLMETLNQGDPVEVVASNLQPNTRLVIVSHILWNTGQVLPLQELVAACHRHTTTRGNRTQVLVDAAQSVGVLSLNLAEVAADFYAFTGHKWWCGPAGVGGLYVHPPAFETLSPTFIGWRGIAVDSSGRPEAVLNADGSRFEVATSAYPLYAGLQAAIAAHGQWGEAAARYQRICALSANLWERLSQIEGVNCLRKTAPEAGLVSFQIPGKSHVKLMQFLETRGLQIRRLLDPDCARACVHYFTLESEIEQLVSAIAQFCQQA